MSSSIFCFGAISPPESAVNKHFNEPTQNKWRRNRKGESVYRTSLRQLWQDCGQWTAWTKVEVSLREIMVSTWKCRPLCHKITKKKIRNSKVVQLNMFVTSLSLYEIVSRSVTTFLTRTRSPTEWWRNNPRGALSSSQHLNILQQNNRGHHKNEFVSFVKKIQ